jgi:hypothetical protein
MKIEVEKFKDGRSLKLKVQFEPAPNFWAYNLTWVPKEDEIKLINESYEAVNSQNIRNRLKKWFRQEGR